MNIQEATQEAVQKGAKIKRAHFGWKRASIRPTDTPMCCYVFIEDKAPCRGWQPSAEDLMADDWIVVS